MTALIVTAAAGVLGALCARPLARLEPSTLGPSPATRARYSASLTMPAVLALLCAGAAAVTVISADRARMPGEVFLAVVVVAAAAADLIAGRLPNVLVVPAIALAAVLLGAEEAHDPAAGSLTTAIGWSVGLGVLFTAAALVAPTHVGMGDGRFLALCALVVGYGELGRIGVLLLALAFLAVVLHAVALARLRPGLVPLGALVAAASLIALWWPEGVTLLPGDVLGYGSEVRP